MDDKDRKLIVKFVSIFLGVATLFVAVEALSGLKEYGHIGRNPQAQSMVTVYGSGEATATPDIAEVSFSIVAEGTKVAEVQDKAAQVENAVLEYLKGKGIAERDIKTQNYSLNPRYEYRQQICSPTYCPPAGDRTLVGYEVREMITIKVRDIDQAGEVVGALGGLGVTDVSGINLTVDDPEEVKREARAEAIADAKYKADQLAEDLGVRLVGIVSFSDDAGGMPYPYMLDAKMGMGGAETSVLPARPVLPVGENVYRSNVTITYEIE